MVELRLEVPGTYMVEDHSISRDQKGAMAFLVVDGPENPAVFQALHGSASSGH